METVADLKMPPPECPNNGLCLSIIPILKAHREELDRHEESIKRNDEAIVRIGRQVDGIGVRETEREKSSNKFFSLLLAVVGITLIHLCLFLVWIGRTGERLDTMQQNDKFQTETIHQIEKAVK